MNEVNEVITQIASSNPFGNVAAPPGLNRFAGGDVSGLPVLLNIIFKTLIVLAGIMTVVNLILAGYWFISASGDPKRVHDAWAKIWQSILGLAVAAGAFLIAGVAGRVIFGNADAILQLQIFTPN